MVTLRTTLVATGGTTTGIEVPEDVVAGLGRGKRVPVVVTINGHAYRGSIAPYSGGYWVGVSAANRAAAGIEAGEPVEVDLAVDDAPRTVEVPADLAAALAAGGPAVAEAWAALSYSKQRAHVLAVEGAKTDATRERRVASVVAALG
ncbi:YdeI/OmpD-associated family protein [Cellulomonas sp. Y8]|jgi:hypothetical protein|uniref:YdeI/OmpD-associated family protein n=1 Tax=Cellulomonas sp. Y8 TaxID=2591145 RepID=UPI003D725D3F